MAKDLKNSIVVDGDEYNINAVKAEKVANPLTVNTVNFNGQTASQSVLTYDGYEPKELEIFPTTGGKFKGPIRVFNANYETAEGKSNVNNKGEIVADAVLNYGDIKNKVLNQLLNTTVLYSWNGEKLNPNIENIPTTFNGISLVLGSFENLNVFHKQNNEKKTNNTDIYLSSYIYIDEDTGNLYLGKVDEEQPVQLAYAATQADKLTKILPTTEGGTGVGVDSLDDIAVGKAKQLYTSHKIAVDLAKSSKSSLDEFNGSAEYNAGVFNVLSEVNGGTGKTKLTEVKVGSASRADSADIAARASDNKVIHLNYYKISEDNVINTGDNRNGDVAKIITYSTNSPEGGNVGDIWIQYSE